MLFSFCCFMSRRFAFAMFGRMGLALLCTAAAAAAAAFGFRFAMWHVWFCKKKEMVVIIKF